MKWYKRKTKGRHTCCFGLSKVFRGFGIMIRVNDPYALKQFVTFELDCFGLTLGSLTKEIYNLI